MDKREADVTQFLMEKLESNVQKHESDVQLELATELVDLFNDDDVDISVLDLLDNLGTLNLKLVLDEANPASQAYFGLLGASGGI